MVVDLTDKEWGAIQQCLNLMRKHFQKPMVGARLDNQEAEIMVDFLKNTNSARIKIHKALNVEANKPAIQGIDSITPAEWDSLRG